MYIHNLDPVLFSIGPVSIRWYGLVYVLGFIAAYYGFRKLGKLSSKDADSLVTWLVVGLLLGARSFFFAFYRPDLFSIGQFFAIWNGGMSFHGALVGLGIAAFLWARKHNEDIWRIFDIGALIAPAFLALGRIANFINGEIVGTAFDGAWCVVFPGYEGCRHPLQLYAMIKNIIIGGLLILLWRAHKFSNGFIFWSFALLYGVFRFIVNFWKDEPIVLLSVFKMGHILSFILIAVSVFAIIYKHKADVKKIFNSA